MQQLMDQMSVQVMNTQLQLQQSLQQLIAMGTQSNQSVISVPAVNQNQLVLSANQQQTSAAAVVNNQQENAEVISLYPLAVHTKNAPERDHVQVKQNLLNAFESEEDSCKYMYCTTGDFVKMQ